MRDYGRVAPTFWTRGSGKKLRGKPEAQVVALYLFTCPASTMIGIYHLAIPTMAHEIGLSVERAERALAEVIQLDIARYDADEELVYLPEGARYQVGERLKPGDKRVKGIEAALAQFARHPFALDFAQRYAGDFGLTVAPSEPLRSPFGAPSEPLREAPSESLRSPSEAPSEPLGSLSAPGEMPLASLSAPAEKPLASQARQGKEQAKQVTHTRDARALAREDSTGDGDRDADGVRAMATLEELGELLRGTVLQPLAGDENTLRLVLGGYHMAHGDRATAELARQAVARLIGREGVRLQNASVEVLSERLGTYLTDPRLRQRAESPGGGPLPQPVREVLVIFGDEWQHQKRRAFVAADGDEQRAAKLLAAAERACSEHREFQPLDVVRRWAREYVRDQDPYLADREHPLALLLSRLTSYGLPKVAKKPPREPTAEPEQPCALPPELARFGTGGGGPVPPRKGAPKAAAPAEPAYAPPPPLESFLGPPAAPKVAPHAPKPTEPGCAPPPPLEAFLRSGGGSGVPPQGGDT